MAHYITESEILGKVQELEDKHKQRKLEHELDHSLWRLDEYILDEVRANRLIKKEDYPSFTSNAPRTLSRVMMAMLTKNPILLKSLLPSDVPEEEEDVINSNELLIHGALRAENTVRKHRGDNTLQWDLGWYAAHRGGVVIRPLFVPGSRNQFRLNVYDPYECAWERGEDCMAFVVRHYAEDKAAVEQTYKVQGLEADTDNRVEMYDVWYVDCGEDNEVEGSEGEIVKVPGQKHDVYNCVIAGDTFVKEPTHHPEFKCNPVYVHRAGGSPSSSQLSSGSSGGMISGLDPIADQWESMYTGVRETVGWMNRATTLYATYLRNGAIGPWIYRGNKNRQIEKGLKPFKVVEIGEREEFGPTALPPMAAEAKEFLALVRGEWQKAGVSDIVFGDVPFAISGFGMLQLRGAVEVLVSNFIHTIEDAYESIADEITSQFVVLGGRKKYSFSGFDNRQKEFFTKIKPSDIQKEYVIKATLKEGLPKDYANIGQSATLWKQSGVPTKKIFEDVFEFEDSGAMARESLREQILQIPEVLLAKAVEALVKSGDQVTAELVLRFIQMQQGGGEQPGPEGEPTGAIPQASPPEMGGAGEREGNTPRQPTGRPGGKPGGGGTY